MHDVGRAEQIVGSTSQLYFYDWEANAITPNGKTVASQLLAQDPTANEISQGSGGDAGAPGAGSLGLYQAVKLASKQPAAPTTTASRQYLSRLGPEYFLFGAPGSAACKTLAARQHTKPTAGQHCFIAGGADIGTRAQLQQDLSGTSLTHGIPIAGNELLAVPQGWVVLQAVQTSTNAKDQVKFADPTAEFYVLHDHYALKGSEITNPQASTAQGGQPDVTFGFTSKGSRAFQRVTGTIAHRGQNLRLGKNANFQHFATALDTQLLTVPQIDYTQYPDGIVNTGGSGGAEIDGSFTEQTASDLAPSYGWARCRSTST